MYLYGAVGDFPLVKALIYFFVFLFFVREKMYRSTEKFSSAFRQVFFRLDDRGQVLEEDRVQVQLLFVIDGPQETGFTFIKCDVELIFNCEKNFHMI